MVEQFFIKVSEGDVRSIIILLLLTFILYVILRALHAVYKKGEGFFRLLILGLGLVILYGCWKFPDTVQIWFLALADGLTVIVESLFIQQPPAG